MHYEVFSGADTIYTKHYAVFSGGGYYLYFELRSIVWGWILFFYHALRSIFGAGYQLYLTLRNILRGGYYSSYALRVFSGMDTLYTKPYAVFSGGGHYLN